MKKSRRILSFLVAVLMLISTFSAMAGALAPYKDSAIPSSAYNDLDQPALSLNQCSSMLLDYVDKILAEKNIILDLGVFGTLDLTSVDKALGDSYFILSGVDWNHFRGILGDLRDLDNSAISTYRRASTPAAGADTNVIYSLIEFLCDNRAIFSKIIDGAADWGILNQYVDFSGVNVNQSIKELLFKQANPGAAVPEPVNESADNMIQQIITNLVAGSAVPQLAGSIDLNGSAVAYDFMDKLMQDAYNLVLVPMLNTDLKKAVREFCGVAYDDPAYPEGDESNLNEYAAVFDIDYVVPAHTFAAGATVMSELNNILYDITDAVTLTYTGWAAGDNVLLLGNLASAAKYVLKNTDSGFFEDYIAKATDAEIDAMNNQQLFSYIIRSVLNSAVDTMNIPAGADSLVKVAWYALKEVLAEKVPQNDYSAEPQTLDGLLNMLGDLAVYYINQTADMNPAAGALPGEGLLPYGQTFDVTLTAIMSWVKTNFGGLIFRVITGTDGWADINTLMAEVIPANWINGFTNVKTLVKTQVLQSVLDLNTAGLFALFDHVEGNDLSSKTIKKVVLERAAKLLNLVTPGALKSTYTTFDALISNAELKIVFEMVCFQIYTRRLQLVPAVLPLAAKALGLSTPQRFENLSLILPHQISAATTFQIRNDSAGINTGATNKDGIFAQDSLYKIRINTVASNIPAITPTDLGGTFINGGESVNCTLSGTFAANQVLIVTVSYDVFTEIGTKLTDTPLTALGFTYISGALDDGLTDVTLDPNSDNTHSLKYKNIYCNQDYTLADLAAQDRFVIKRATTSLTDNNSTATVTRTSASVHAALAANGITAAPFTNISTTYDGGTWNIMPFAVDSAAGRPADGAYLSTFVYSASKTYFLKTAETFTVPHYVVFYDDFGLPGLLESELNAKRDPADYSDSALWDEYIFALRNAVSVQYRPRTASTFMAAIAPAYQDAVQMLNETITALEASALLDDPLAPVPQVIDAINPSNPPGMSYDDPAYNYFGMADYVPYTFLNYQREVDNCRALIASQEQAGAAALRSIDVAYALHRLNLYASRMIRVQADKSRLSEAIATAGSPEESLYTRASWIPFEHALAFASLVNAQSTSAVDGSGEYILRQTKVDTAREELVASFKQLVRVADYTQLFALIAEAQSMDPSEYTPESWAPVQIALTAALAVPLQMSNTPDHQAIIDEAAAALRDAMHPDPFPPFIILEPLKSDVKIGLPGHPSFLAGLDVGVGAANCVTSSEGGFLLFNDGPGGPGTGAAVNLFKNSGVLFKVYITIIFGDVNGDANITGLDAGIVVNVENYLISWDTTATDAAMMLAGDVNNDGNITGTDAGILVNIENFAQDIDQSTGSS